MSEEDVKPPSKPVDLVMLHPDGKTEIHVAAHLVADCLGRGFRPLGTVADYEEYQARAKAKAEAEQKGDPQVTRIEIEQERPAVETAASKPKGADKASKDESAAK